MSAPRKSLPDYSNPPVNEVVLGVQFAPLERLLAVHMGLFWQRIRQRYPRISDQAPVNPVFELFDGQPEQKPQVEFADKPPLRRCWFLDETENRLVQLQDGRFLHNWREITGSEQYPRYVSIREEFDVLWREFLCFADEEHVGKVSPNQWEVTYINHIYQNEGWDSLADLRKLFPWWSGEGSVGYLEPPETGDVRLSFGFPEHRGRLHVRLDVRLRKSDRKKLLRLNLTARGNLDSEDPENLLRCLDVGHEWIVWGFTDLTSDQAHTLWGRQDV
jgi:uncharacterized protein (TIGR04255 family)